MGDGKGHVSLIEMNIPLEARRDAHIDLRRLGVSLEVRIDVA